MLERKGGVSTVSRSWASDGGGVAVEVCARANIPMAFGIHTQIENVMSAIPLLEWPELEHLLIWAVKHELLTLRIDYKAGQINQRASTTNASASSEVRDSLSKFAFSLEAVAETLHAADIERRKSEVRSRLYGSIAAGVEEEHKKVLQRRLIIERRKEEQARFSPRCTPWRRVF